MHDVVVLLNVFHGSLHVVENKGLKTLMLYPKAGHCGQPFFVSIWPCWKHLNRLLWPQADILWIPHS